MPIKRILSYALGFLAGLLAVAPPIGYSIPVMVNSYSWLYLLVVSGFLGMYLLFTKIPLALKILSVYLFAGCFFSEIPYVSFNAYICVVVAMYCYLAFLECDFKIVLDFITAAFLIEAVLTIAQLLGKDTLTQFGRPEKVFLGTVLQYMRYSSLLAIMAPLLIFKNKWFAIPVVIFCALSKSSSFALALVAGTAVYFWLTQKSWRMIIVALGVICAAIYLWYDWESLHAELGWGRWTVWPEIVRSNVLNTKLLRTVPLSGPWDLKAMFFGRGLDTFLGLFPIYKWDPNPFPQAHNMFLQLSWEIGLAGLGIFLGYCGWLLKKLYRQKAFLMVAGLVCIGVNAFFTMPDRQTQTMLLMVAYLAFCEQHVRGVRYANTARP